jgi:hypothetical protein
VDVHQQMHMIFFTAELNELATPRRQAIRKSFRKIPQ